MLSGLRREGPESPRPAWAKGLDWREGRCAAHLASQHQLEEVGGSELKSSSTNGKFRASLGSGERHTPLILKKQSKTNKQKLLKLVN